MLSASLRSSAGLQRALARFVGGMNMSTRMNIGPVTNANVNTRTRTALKITFLLAWEHHFKLSPLDPVRTHGNAMVIGSKALY
jgi:hypothetical protein